MSPCPPILCRPVNGRIKLLMQLKGTESDGCNRSTWFTTIAVTLNVSLKVSQLNASDQGSSREAKLAYIFNFWFLCINMNSLFFVQNICCKQNKSVLPFFFLWKENKSVGTICSALRSSYCIIKSNIWLLNSSSNLEVIRLGRHDYRLRTREDYSTGHHPALSAGQT